MGMTHSGEDSKDMTDATTQMAEENADTRRRLHLRDITQDQDAGAADGVGAELRAERLRRAEDLRVIAMSLRIRRDQLEALEEGRYRALPGRAYAIGFIRSYAEYLGLDVAQIVDRYRAEYDRDAQGNSDFTFPKADAVKSLPKGVLLIVAAVMVVGAYGGYLLTRSADGLMAERIPPVPERVEASAAANATDKAASAETPATSALMSGDVASAAASLGNSPQSVYAPDPPALAVTAPAPASEAVLEAAPQVDAAAPVADVPPEQSALPALPSGQAFGAENVEGRVVVRARKSDAWIRVEDASGNVLLERTLNPGDSYRAPKGPGVILVARDASAFEILVDGRSLGLAGPPSLVLTGKPLDADALVAAAPKPVEIPAVAGQAVAPADAVAPAAIQ
jgi:cytoskeleton protein RodZ